MFGGPFVHLFIKLETSADMPVHVNFFAIKSWLAQFEIHINQKWANIFLGHLSETYYK